MPDAAAAMTLATHRIAVLTPDPADASYAGLWPRVLARLQGALARHGIEAEPTAWTVHADDPAALAGYRLVLPLLAWGYHLDHARWLRACAAWERAGVPMANPAEVLAWNSDKRYLATLAGRGVPVPATTVIEGGVRAADLEAAFAATGAQALIVKPAVSGGAWRTLRIARGEDLGAALADAAPGDGSTGQAMLVQPYLPTIEREGETSLLYFGGRLSHVVNKRPPDGEFRVQEQFGGRYAPIHPPRGALVLAEQVLAAIDAPLLYARIDTVPDAGGRWLLMEAELIEPDFYLGVDPAAGDGFARAVAARLAA